MKGRRFSLDAVVLLALLLILAGLSVRIAGRGQKNTPETGNPRRTVTSARRGGWKAAYLVLQKRNIAAKRWERAPAEWPKTARVMVSGQEYFSIGFGSGLSASMWNEAETSDALEWVEKGGTLILMTSDDNTLTEELGLKVQEDLHKDAKLPLRQPAPYLAGVKEIRIPDAHRWTKKPAGALTLFGDSKPAVVVMTRGQGRVVAVATAALIDNAHLTEADNARFFVNLVTAFNDKGQPILFDEYHQGFQEADSFWKVVGRPGQLAFFQFVALLLLICYSAGVRFGLARPAPLAARLSSEYVASLANLYRRARAADVALEGVYLSFWRDLCRAVGLPLDTPTSEVARRAAATLGDTTMTTTGAQTRRALEERLNALLYACEGKLESAKIKERDLLSLTRELEEMRKELGLGRDDDPAGR